MNHEYEFLKNITLILFALLLMAFHPLHLSMTNFDYREDDKKCFISVKVFSDDFSSLMRHKYGSSYKATGDTICVEDSLTINQYVRDNLKISLNGRRIYMNNWQMDSVKNNFEASWIFYSFDFSEQLHEISVRNTIFFDSFKDQKNLMIIGNEEKEKAIQFSIRKPVISIRF